MDKENSLLKKLDFKQKKYIFPLIGLPFLLFFGYVGANFVSDDEEKAVAEHELSTSLGDTADSILSKNDAYENSNYARKDYRSMLDGLDDEQDSLQYYTDNLNDRQRRYIDSLEEMKRLQNEKNRQFSQQRESYYTTAKNDTRREDEQDYQRSMEIMRMLNGEATGNGYSGKNNQANNDQNQAQVAEKEEDPVSLLRKQMIMLDSLEKSKDPEYQAQLKASQRLKQNKTKMENFLKNTLTVTKGSLGGDFNTVFKEQETSFVKAIIDENIKGYLGSRIRFRLLEDVFVGKHKIPKGTILYGSISGFTLQRVNLNVVSIMSKGEILPINLSVYDVDGMEGLYVPASAFREMLREMGSNSVQGMNLESNNSGFFSSIASNLFSSTSQTIANIIRKNKVKLKYNSYIYLINQKQLKQNENQ